MKRHNTAQRLNMIMEERNLKQADIIRLAEPYCARFRIKLGKSDMSQFVSGKVEPGQWKLTILAMALNVTESWLMGYDEPMNSDDTRAEPTTPEGFEPIHKTRIPMLGTIAAGEPIYADEEHETYVVANDDYHADFALRIAGDSMEGAGINNGDVVLIRQQDDVNDGQIAAVIIDDCATLKRVYHSKDHVTLVAENPKYAPMIFGRDGETVRIIGKAVACISRID